MKIDSQELKGLMDAAKHLGIEEFFTTHPQSLFERKKLAVVQRSKKNPDLAPEKEVLRSFTPILKTEKELLSMSEDLCKNIKTLDDLKNAMIRFDGCDLKKMATNMVFSDGVPNSKIMLIGEAPGAEEDRLGKPFVGQSGQLLDKTFSTLGLSREKNIYITNTIPYRPPANRTPTSQEMALFKPFLMKHIELISPKALVLVGATAFKSLLDEKAAITKVHGTWFDLKVQDQIIPTIGIYHPAYLLRSPSQKRALWQDLIKIHEKTKHLR